MKSHYVNQSNYNIQVGVDEVARGTLFGRVYAAACIFPLTCIDDLNNYNENKKKNEKVIIRDSKKLSKIQRLKAYTYIKEHALYYKVSYLDANVIDKIDIRKASLQAMNNAINELISNNNIKPELLLIDGDNFNTFIYDFNIIIPHVCIIQGDAQYFSIACASILAKVEHDKYINDLTEQYPHLDIYDLKNNMGYGTKNHMDSLKKYGGSPWHRWSYRPVMLTLTLNNKKYQSNENDINEWIQNINNILI